MSTRYRRTPLPKAASMPVGWLALWLVLLFASPWVGFAVHGRVDAAGLVAGLALLLLPLLALAVLAFRRWRALRRLPAALREEWRTGRIVPARGAPEVAVPARFERGPDWLELRAEGATVSSHALLGMQGVEGPLALAWAARQSGRFFIAWGDVAEWVVATDSDGPDEHRLRLHGAGVVRLRRFRPARGCECELLDAVRSVGRLPVRLLCDVDCA